MTKPQKRRDLVREITKAGYTYDRDHGPHSVYRCPCGKHIAAVPRHAEVSAGTIRNIARAGECMPKGWLN